MKRTLIKNGRLINDEKIFESDILIENEPVCSSSRRTSGLLRVAIIRASDCLCPPESKPTSVSI